MAAFAETELKIAEALDTGIVGSGWLKGNFADIFFNVVEGRPDIASVAVSEDGKIVAELKFFNTADIFEEDLQDPEIKAEVLGIVSKDIESE